MLAHSDQSTALRLANAVTRLGKAIAEVDRPLRRAMLSRSSAAAQNDPERFRGSI
jgi:hypothetical protein